jgi:hypothetical protein
MNPGIKKSSNQLLLCLLKYQPAADHLTTEPTKITWFHLYIHLNTHLYIITQNNFKIGMCFYENYKWRRENQLLSEISILNFLMLLAFATVCKLKTQLLILET